MNPWAYDDTHAHVARKRPAGTTWPGGRPRSSLVLGGLVLAAVVSTRWVRVNVSPSIPLGLYRLAAVAPPLARGTLVVLPVPPAVQRWHSAWLPLLQPIAALPGDLVCTSEAGRWSAGQAGGPVSLEAGGAPLPRLRGCVRVPAGAVFLASPAPRSRDSQDGGMVPITASTAVARPVGRWQCNAAQPVTKGNRCQRLRRTPRLQRALGHHAAPVTTRRDCGMASHLGPRAWPHSLRGSSARRGMDVTGAWRRLGGRVPVAEHRRSPSSP